MRNYAACLVLAILCSCTIQRRIYSPTQINNPSLREKNDHAFSLTYSGPSGFDFTGGYAVTNRFALIGGGYAYRNNDQQTQSSPFSGVHIDSKLLYKHHGFHGGLGFYFPLSQKPNRTFASFFTGYTLGKFDMNEHQVRTDGNNAPMTHDFVYNSDIGRYFIQGSFTGYMDQLEMSVSMRYNYITYSNSSTDYSPEDQRDFRLPPNGYSRNSEFLDLGFEMKYYFSNDGRFGMNFFAMGTTRLNRKEFDFDYYGYRVGMGIVVRNPFKKK